MSSRLLPAPGLWSPWHKAALNLLWPAHCAACDSPLAADDAVSRFCHDCTASLSPVTSPFCAICCEPFTGAIADDFTCPNCMGQPQHYAFAVAAFMSRGPIRAAIHHFKYGRRIALRLPLASLLLNALNDPRIAARKDWILVPVPLHPRRLREREFNQSAELANSLSSLSGLPVVNALRRLRYTSTQAALRREDRLLNLKSAFDLRWRAARHTSGRPILLVDDVLTTGSTANACAAVLKQKGAAQTVAVLTVARG